MNEVIERMFADQSQQIISLQNQLIEAHLTIDNLEDELNGMKSQLNYYQNLFSGTEDPVHELNELIIEMKEKRLEYKMLITELKLLRKSIV